MPVRTISNWGGNIIGAIPSRKLQRMVHYESLIERAYIYLLEHDPQIPSYEEQPYTIRYLFEGKEHHYTPDFHVTRSQRKALLVECKPEALIHDSIQKVKWTAAQLWCERNNTIFTVVTDRAIQRQSALLSNLQLLAIHAHQPIPSQVREHMLSIFANLENPFTVMDVVQRASRLNEYHVKSYLWQWLYLGELEANLFVPLQFRTTALFWKGPNYDRLKTAAFSSF